MGLSGLDTGSHIVTGTARVQYASNSVTSGTTVTATFGTATTLHNLLVAILIVENGQTGTSVTLTGGSDTFTKDGGTDPTNPTVTNMDMSVWSDPNCSAGHTAVVGHWASSAAAFLHVWDVSSAALSSVLASVTAAGNPAATLQSSFDSGAASTAPAGSFWVGAVQSVGSGGRATVTPSGSWTSETAMVPGSLTTSLGAYQANTASGSPDFAGSFTSHTSYWASIAAAYKAASKKTEMLMVCGIG